jgi:hypothetical protein
MPGLSKQQEAIVRFYREIDTGAFPQDLFAADFQFFLPKFGVGRGRQEFLDVGRTFPVARHVHHIEDLLFIEQGNAVAVEGTTEGTGVDGVSWCGGQTSGGRFSSIFVFDGDGLIERMHVYLDPDFTGADKARIYWPPRAAQAW